MTWQRRARLARDVGVSVLVVTAQLAVWLDDAYAGERASHAVLAALFTLPGFVAHRFPLVAAALVSASAFVQYELGGGLPQAWFSFLLISYALGAYAGTTAALAGAGLVAAALLAVDVPRLRSGTPVEDVLPAWLVLAGTTAFGRWMRVRRTQTVELVEHARGLELDRAAAARLAVNQERARLARELHDLVAHSMAVTVLQAQAARRVLPVDPDAAGTALRAIEELSRQGLDELRRLLGMLDTDGPPSLDPVPTLEGLPELVDHVRAAGADISLAVQGRRPAVPPGVDLSAYRIVQESLTNVLKHAGPAARACVTVRYDDGGVDLRVEDDGPGAAGVDSSGHGLVGIRERVSLFGGELETGNRAEGGFFVHARLPLRSGA